MLDKLKGFVTTLPQKLSLTPLIRETYQNDVFYNEVEKWYSIGEVIDQQDLIELDKVFNYLGYKSFFHFRSIYEENITVYSRNPNLFYNSFFYINQERLVSYINGMDDSILKSNYKGRLNKINHTLRGLWITTEINAFNKLINLPRTDFIIAKNRIESEIHLLKFRIKEGEEYLSGLVFHIESEYTKRLKKLEEKVRINQSSNNYNVIINNHTNHFHYYYQNSVTNRNVSNFNEFKQDYNSNIYQNYVTNNSVSNNNQYTQNDIKNHFNIQSFITTETNKAATSVNMKVLKECDVHILDIELFKFILHGFNEIGVINYSNRNFDKYFSDGELKICWNLKLNELYFTLKALESLLIIDLKENINMFLEFSFYKEGKNINNQVLYNIKSQFSFNLIKLGVPIDKWMEEIGENHHAFKGMIITINRLLKPKGLELG